MKQENTDYSAVVFLALFAALLAMMSATPLLLVFGIAATTAGVTIGFILQRYRRKVQSILPHDLLPTPEELEAVIAKYRTEIEKFWQDWKAHH